jgi:hypothetical protein
MISAAVASVMLVTPASLDAPPRRQGCEAPPPIVCARAVLSEMPMEAESVLLSYKKEWKNMARTWLEMSKTS